jgi:hypothetical protein
MDIRAEFQTDHEHYAIVEKFGEAAEIVKKRDLRSRTT